MFKVKYLNKLSKKQNTRKRNRANNSVDESICERPGKKLCHSEVLFAVSLPRY